jgi:hypothetical protein
VSAPAVRLRPAEGAAHAEANVDRGRGPHADARLPSKASDCIRPLPGGRNRRTNVQTRPFLCGTEASKSRVMAQLRSAWILLAD